MVITMNCIQVPFVFLVHSGGHGSHGHATRFRAAHVHAMCMQCRVVPIECRGLRRGEDCAIGVFSRIPCFISHILQLCRGL